MFKKFTERVTAKGTAVFGNVTSSTGAITGSEQAMNQDGSPLFAEEKQDERTLSKNSLSEKINSESVSAAASIAASSMMGFMKKASSVASVAVREGSAKAVMLKNKALDAADMDALQRKLSYALDRQTGEVNLSLLNFSYIADNIVAMGFPSMNSGANRVLLKDNPIDLVAMYLNEKHAGHYMVWNLSEETYDYAYFDNQVLEFNFPGHPAPPLGLIFKICSSIEAWLSADEKNIAAIHCLTGKGRTGTVIACYLAWVGLYPNAMEALECVSEQRKSTVEKLTIPSQRRYIQYFTNIMDGLKPRSSPLLLRRVIMNTIPVFGTRRAIETKEHAPQPVENLNEGSDNTENDGETTKENTNAPFDTSAVEPIVEEVVEEGCCPYLQIFKGGKLVFTTTWRDMEKGNGVQWASVSDGSISFNINCLLQGDILVRCRHLTDSGERVSMFRGAFHTGYIPQGILRLTKAQLDGACQDDRFDQDFFIDLIFADVETDGTPVDAESIPTPQSEGIALTEEDKQAYEDMLHRDEAFWSDIESRKERLKVKREELQKKREAEAAARAAAEAEAAAKAAAEAEALAQAKAAEEEKAKAEAENKANASKLTNVPVPQQTQAAFSIAGPDEDLELSKSKSTRKGSWDEEKDKELMSELESLTSSNKLVDEEELMFQSELEEKPASSKTQSSTTSLDGLHDPMAGLAKEFEDMQKLEKELGLESFSSELASLPDGKGLDLLDMELKGLDGGSPSKKGKSPTDKDLFNFGADDFDELEQYLSGLSSKTE